MLPLHGEDAHDLEDAGIFGGKALVRRSLVAERREGVDAQGRVGALLPVGEFETGGGPAVGRCFEDGGGGLTGGVGRLSRRSGSAACGQKQPGEGRIEMACFHPCGVCRLWGKNGEKSVPANFLDKMLIKSRRSGG
ncbi:hypothetical protein B5E60_00805 [Alistipes sp. An116]|nr:hypothetical protein B5E60_00805 [Alistipes sp. An116]